MSTADMTYVALRNLFCRDVAQMINVAAQKDRCRVCQVYARVWRRDGNLVFCSNACWNFV
jgi:hypothetical protein